MQGEQVHPAHAKLQLLVCVAKAEDAMQNRSQLRKLHLERGEDCKVDLVLVVEFHTLLLATSKVALWLRSLHVTGAHCEQIAAHIQPLLQSTVELHKQQEALHSCSTKQLTRSESSSCPSASSHMQGKEQLPNRTTHPPEEDHASAGSTQRLVCGGGHHVAVLEWLRCLLCRNQAAAGVQRGSSVSTHLSQTATCSATMQPYSTNDLQAQAGFQYIKISPDVRHVHEQVGADLVGDGPQPGVVPLAGVRRPAADDHLRPEVQCLLLQLVVVDQPRL